MSKIIVAGVEVLVKETEQYIQANDINGVDLDIFWQQIKDHYKQQYKLSRKNGD